MKYIVFIYMFFILLEYAGYSQSPHFESYKVLKQYKDVEVNTLLQDSAGYIWLGTNYGLVKYDGVDFTLFTAKDGLCQNRITSLGIDHGKNIWIGHKTGEISIFKGKEFSKFDPEEGLSKREISSFYTDNSGVVWFSTLNEGVYFYSGEKRKRLYNLNTDDGLLDNYVYNIVQDSLGLFYFSTDKGISVYNETTKEFVKQITTKDGLPDNLIKKLELYGNQLWIATHTGGICCYNTTDKTISKLSGWEFGPVTDMAVWNQDQIWIATERKGLIQCQYDSLQNSWFTGFGRKNGISNIRMQDILIDREKNLWIGTKSGLSVRKNNYIEFFDPQSGFDLNNIFGITRDDYGKFWIASQDGLYVIYRDKMGMLHKNKLFDSPEFQNTSFISLYKDYYGNIWAGTYGFGAYKINPLTHTYTLFNKENGLCDDNVIHITGDSLTIVFSTFGGGITEMCIREDINAFKTYNIDSGLTSNYIYSSYIENQNKIWVATDGGGIAKIENGKVSHLTDPLIDSVARFTYSILKDYKGNYWFTAVDAGLILYNGKEFYHFTEEDGLSSNSILGIIENSENQLLLVSNNGIDFINIETFQNTHIGEESDVAYLEPNVNAIYKDEYGNILIGTGNSIIQLNRQDKGVRVKPIVLITQKRLFYNEINKEINTFKHSENHLTFNFIALWYKSASNLMYRYKLENYDLDWSFETANRAITYSFLPPGNYTFKVEVKMPDGEYMGSSNATFSFTIKPPFWKTTWFIILSIITGLTSVFWFIRYRTIKLQRDKENLEEEVKKRTMEIQKQKEEIEAQRDEIEVQRNYVISQRDKIEFQNKEITSSIQYASRIQRAVLPPKDSFKELLGDYFIMYKPKDIVSGDFYYLNSVGDCTVVAAADCTGHGVPGAFMSLLGVSLLNQIMGQLIAPFTASEILNKLRSELKTSLRQTGKSGETKDGMDISLCVINKKSMYLQYAGAYNPLLLVRNKDPYVYKADKMPIGVYLKDEQEFTNHKIAIQTGDMLYMYSDGFQDQFGGTDSRKFLPRRLRNLLIELSGSALTDQKLKLEQTFDEWRGNGEQIDDVVVLGVKI